jgi:septal ring factor EnvC (AmiA/AmiB activator)
MVAIPNKGCLDPSPKTVFPTSIQEQNIQSPTVFTSMVHQTMIAPMAAIPSSTQNGSDVMLMTMMQEMERMKKQFEESERARRELEEEHNRIKLEHNKLKEAHHEEMTTIADLQKTAKKEDVQRLKATVDKIKPNSRNDGSGGLMQITRDEEKERSTEDVRVIQGNT